MKPLVLFLLLAANLLVSPFPSPAQPSSPPHLSNSPTVSAQELSFPKKARQAFEKGTLLLAKGDMQASLPYFRTAIEVAPSYYRAYHNLGVAQYRLGQFNDAALNFQKSIDLSNGSYAHPLFALSMVLYQRGEFSQAETLIQRGLLIAPRSPVGHYCQGTLQLALGHVTEAQNNALETLRLDPSLYDAHLLLARIHEHLHNPNAMLAEVQTYLRLAPDGDLRSEAFALRQRAQEELAQASASAN